MWTIVCASDLSLNCTGEGGGEKYSTGRYTCYLRMPYFVTTRTYHAGQNGFLCLLQTTDSKIEDI